MASLYNELVNFLVEVCIDDANTTYVDGILTSAREAISSGGGVVSSLTNSGVNGKSFSRAVHLSAIEVARACQVAKKIYGEEDDEIAQTYPDFSSLNH